MAPPHFLIIGAGAAGLMTARELARAGKKVRRVRPWRGTCDACLDAGGGAFAAADRGYSMACPQRRILAARVSACSCSPTATSLKRVENRFTDR